MLRAASAAPLANGTTKALVVYIPYFGAPPPWYNLSLLSMALNDDVQWVLIGDKLPSAWPFNVQRRHMTFAQYRERLEHLTNRSLRAWRDTTCSGERCGSARLNKVPDTRPFLGALFARTSRRYRWWAWADMDVIWGQLTRFLLLNSTTHDVITPMYPNDWSLRSWGPFTAFRVSAKDYDHRTTNRPWLGLEVFRLSKSWEAVIESKDLKLFDEAGENFRLRKGVTGMGWALFFNRIPTQRQGIPIGEASVCELSGTHKWSPCGAVFARLNSSSLSVNGHDAMLLHLLSSKVAWRNLDAASVALLQAVGQPPASAVSSCFQIDGLARSSATRAQLTEATTHRPVWPWRKYGLNMTRLDELGAGVDYDSGTGLSVQACRD